MTQDTPGEDDLQAWVDGRLDTDRARAVTTWLDANPGEKARLAAYRQQNALLHDLFDPVLEEPLPDRLLPARVRSGTRRVRALAAAAAVLLFLAGGAGGWVLRGGSTADLALRSLPDEAVAAHRVFVTEVRHPVEVAADQEAHLVGWLSKRLGQPLRAPHLAKLGFNLMGGRLLASGEGPAAQFMYQNEAGRRLTLYVRAAAKDADTAFRVVHEEGVSAFYWIDRGLGYALIGDLDRPHLLDAANAVYRQVSEAPAH